VCECVSTIFADHAEALRAEQDSLNITADRQICVYVCVCVYVHVSVCLLSLC